MTLNLKAAIRQVLREEQRHQLHLAPRCARCGLPLGHYITARLTVTDSRLGRRVQTDADVGACTCPQEEEA